MSFLVFVALFFSHAAAVAVGAFSHKYLASEVKSVTGLDAQAVANQVNAKVKKSV